MTKRRYDVLCDELAARRTDQRRREKFAYDIARNFRAAFASFLGVDDEDFDDRLVFLVGLVFKGDEVVVVREAEEHTAIGHVLPNEQHLRKWLQWTPSGGRPEPQIGFDLKCT